MSRAKAKTQRDWKPLYMAGEDAKCYSHPGEQFGNFVKLSKYLPFKLVIPRLDSYLNEMNVFVHLYQNAIQKCLKEFNHNLSKTGRQTKMSLNCRMDREIQDIVHNGAPWAAERNDLVAPAITWMKRKCIVTMKGARLETYLHIYIFLLYIGFMWDIYVESGTFHYIYIIIPFIWLLGKGIKSRDKKQIYGCQGLRVGGKCLTTQSQEEGIGGQSGGPLLWLR